MQAQERTVHGTITHADGTAAAGARVRIIDNDAGTDDLMGEVYSGSNGAYTFTWPAGKIWDPPKTSAHTQWRPDLLIKVKWSEESDGQWDAEAATGPRADCRHDRSHRIDARLSAITRTVSGTVRDRNGAVRGARVRAWDRDPTGEEQMGQEALTDAAGKYRITYRSGVWDSPRLPGSTTWRPDIRVTVGVRTQTGFWSRHHVSATHDDHPLRTPLTIDVTMNGKCGLGEPVNCSLPQLVGFAAPHTMLASSEVLFHPACVTHDYCYRHGAQTYGKTKALCDTDFLADMHAICGTPGKLVAAGLTGGASLTTCSSWAQQFYAAVVAGGGAAFRPNGAVCKY
jgi:hypothetical protein